MFSCDGEKDSFRLYRDGCYVGYRWIYFLSDFIVAQKVDFERVRLERGLISVYQFCSEIGKAAVDQTVCKEFNLLHGNETGQDFWSQLQKDFSKLTLN